MSEEKREGLRIEHDEDQPRTGGIGIDSTEGELKPPLGEDYRQEEEPPEARQVTGKIPLSPAVIKPPLRLEGSILAETTGWKGWIYTEQELDELCSLIEQCGVEMSPQFQVFIALGTMHGVRVVGFMDWRRRGRPGDARQKTGVKEDEPRPPGEEVIR